MKKLAPVFLAVFVSATTATPEVVRIDVKRRADVAGGQEFGLAGAYEKLEGRIYFVADPALAPNQIITDIENAPKNADSGPPTSF